MNAAEIKAVDLIRAAGFDTMADEVTKAPSQLRRALHNLSVNRIGGRHRSLFAKALAVLGGYRPDAATATRLRIDGRR